MADLTVAECPAPIDSPPTRSCVAAHGMEDRPSGCPVLWEVRVCLWSSLHVSPWACLWEH